MRSTIELSRALHRLLDFRPGVAQGDGTVEDKLLRSRVGVDAEVSDSLELVARAGLGALPIS